MPTRPGSVIVGNLPDIHIWPVSAPPRYNEWVLVMGDSGMTSQPVFAVLARLDPDRPRAWGFTGVDGESLNADGFKPTHWCRIDELLTPVREQVEHIRKNPVEGSDCDDVQYIDPEPPGGDDCWGEDSQ